MMKLLPTAKLDSVLEAIQTAEADILAVLGTFSPVDAYNAYNTWAIRHARRFSGLVPPSELDRLFLTTRYWSLQSVAPRDYGDPLRAAIDFEMNQRAADLEIARNETLAAAALLRECETAAIVLDTNVLLRHPDGWLQLDWHRMTDERPHVRLDLILTGEVIEELDALKLSRGDMEFLDRPSIPRRTLARRALRTVRLLFGTPTSRPEHVVDGIPRRVVRAQLHLERRLGSTKPADLTLIDTALSLMPFWHRAGIATFDDALVFRAMAAGVDAIRLDDGLDSAV